MDAPGLLDRLLARAAVAGNAERIRILLAKGADARAMNSQCLRIAAELGHEDCVLALLPHADPQAVGPEGLDASASAAWAGRHGVARLVSDWIRARDEEAAIADALAVSKPLRGSDLPRL